MQWYGVFVLTPEPDAEPVLFASTESRGDADAAAGRLKTTIDAVRFDNVRIFVAPYTLQEE